MIIPAVIYLVTVGIFAAALSFTPDHTIRGTLAAITMLMLVASGLVLALEAL